MATRQFGQAMLQIRRAVLQDGAGLTDGQLLDHFLCQGDQAAFAALIRRHGPLVWGVCRRLLGNHHDAEDAFQATWLVLARKAASVKPREFLANWLYGVAHRTALKAKSLIGRRRAKEGQMSNVPEPTALQRDLWTDLEPVLDQELAALPDKYRNAILLCDLEDRTRKDAARQLKIPEGTLSSRLATARVMLAKRLARRGLKVSGGLLATLLCQNAGSASVPVSLVTSTAIAAPSFLAGKVVTAGLISSKVFALIEGVLRSMLLAKLKTAIVGTLLLATMATGFLVSSPAQLPEEPAAIANVGETTNQGVAGPAKFPSAAPLIDYLNDNANRIQGLRCSEMHLTWTQNGQSVGLNGKLALQKPGNLRICGDQLGSRVFDIGANKDEFWWWFSKAQSPLVHCSFKDLSKIRDMAIPFHPQWIMEVLGMGPYGTADRFQLEYDTDTIKLIEAKTSSQGKAVRKIIVCRRQPVRAPQPQVLSYALLDDGNGVEICSARIQKIAVDRETGAIVPTRLELRWPAEKVTLSIRLESISVNAKFNEGVFVRSAMPGIPTFDLGRNQFDDLMPKRPD